MLDVMDEEDGGGGGGDVGEFMDSNKASLTSISIEFLRDAFRVTFLLIDWVPLEVAASAAFLADNFVRLSVDLFFDLFVFDLSPK